MSNSENVVPDHESVTTEPSKEIEINEDVSAGIGLWPDLAFRIVAALGLFWGTLHVAWFLRMNTNLFSGDGDFRFGTFSGILQSDWSFSLQNTPITPVIGSVVLLILTVALGFICVRACDVYLSRWAELALALPVGIGTSGVFFELLGMAGLLNTVFVWGGWAVLIAAGVLVCPLEKRRKGEEDVKNRRPIWRWWGRPDENEDELYAVFDDPSFVDRTRVRRSPIPEDAQLKIQGYGKAFWYFGALLIGLMSLAIFWNAVFFPETYWDSLILYLGYARMMFLEGGFPFKAVGQVGIGLGANYPHLFELYGAVGSAMIGSWSDLFQRSIAPICSLASVILVYYTVLTIWHNRTVAMMVALCFRAIPLGIAYSTYASSYAYAILFTAAFFFLVAHFCTQRTPGAFLLLTLIPAFAMHINYLMGLLGLPWLIALFCVLRPRLKSKISEEEEKAFEGIYDPQQEYRLRLEEEAHATTSYEEEMKRTYSLPVSNFRLQSILRSRTFYVILASCFFVSSTWYVRNWVLTNNPVYAFFPEIFSNTVRYNPEVMESADKEWAANGLGIGRVAAEYLTIIEQAKLQDESFTISREDIGVASRLAASWYYWIGFDTFKLKENGDFVISSNWDRFIHLLMIWKPKDAEYESILGGGVGVLIFHHAFRMAPMFVGFLFPSLLVLLLIPLLIRSGRYSLMRAPVPVAAEALLLSSFFGLFGFLAYHYVLADYYLYQIIPLVVPLCLLFSVLFMAATDGFQRIGHVLQIWSMVLVIILSLVPGLAMSLMNFKVFGGRVYGEDYDGAKLDIFRHPGLDPEIVYRLRFPEDVDAWKFVNEELKGERLLTHENRHLMYDPSIEIVHLDDWEMQQLYDVQSPFERFNAIRDQDIEYYLRIPNEFAHEINRRLGLDELIEVSLLELVFVSGPNEVYQFTDAVTITDD